MNNANNNVSQSDILAAFGTMNSFYENESIVLSIGTEFLPAHAKAVLAGESRTVEYFQWLLTQVSE